MKTYQNNQIKNIALLGNSGSGKTTLAEAMLFEGGVIERRGAVETKNTVSDYNEIELANCCSVFSSLLYSECKETKINILDNPGSDDFVGNVMSSLRVVDSTMMLINAQNGVEVGTEIQSRYIKKAEKPLFFVINQLDHEKANFEKTIEMLKHTFGNKLILFQYPVSTGASFNEIVDVMSMTMLKYAGEGKPAEVLPLPNDQKERAEELKHAIIEAAAENDEKLMEKYFEEGSLNEDEIKKGIMLGVLNRSMLPAFCISAKKNFGVKQLMEFLVDTAPSPNDVQSPKNTDNEEIKCESNGQPSLFVFKTSIEPHIGVINYFKVMSGEITESIDLTNNNNSTKERIAQIFCVAGKNRNKITKICAGDLGATVKLKNTKTNHTLTHPNVSYTFPPIELPEPRYRAAIKPQSEGDEEKLGEVIQRIHDQDLTVIVEYSKELKQILLHGQGEHHLNIVKWHLDNIYKISIQFMAPKIPYRETITKIAQSSYRHKKQSGGAGQFGEVHMVIEPSLEGMANPTTYKVNGQDMKVSVRGKEEIDLPWGGKLIYFNCIVGGSIDARFIPAILKGIMEKMEEGPLTGCHARDIRVAIYDGKMHPVDSNDISFRLAGRNAFREAFKNAGPKILEPIYLVEVLVPSDRMGDVISDLQSRRAILQGMSSEGGYEKISSLVPLSAMDKYSTSLSSLSQGRATYTMKFAKYEQVPPDEQVRLLKLYEEKQTEDE